MELFESSLDEPTHCIELASLEMQSPSGAKENTQSLYSEPVMIGNREIAAATSYEPISSTEKRRVRVPDSFGARTYTRQGSEYREVGATTTFDSLSGLHVVKQLSLVDGRGSGLKRDRLTELVANEDRFDDLRDSLLGWSRTTVEEELDGASGYTLGNPFVQLGERYKEDTVANKEPDWDLTSYTPVATYR